MQDSSTIADFRDLLVLVVGEPKLRIGLLTLATFAALC
jgi:hypothetical protein